MSGPRRSEVQRRLERRSLDSLKEEVAMATKAGCHWGVDGAIALSRRRLHMLERTGDAVRGYGEFASTYYAAAHFAARQIRFHPSIILWAVRLLWDLSRARYWIEIHERIVGFARMSAGALDVYAAIAELRGDLWEKFSPGRARKCYTSALHASLASFAARDRGGLAPDDRALNLIRLAGLRVRVGSTPLTQDVDAEKLFAEAFSMLLDLTPLTAVRVMRNYGEYLARSGDFENAEYHLKRAHVRALAEGLKDQVAKIEPLLSRVRAKKTRAKKR